MLLRFQVNEDPDSGLVQGSKPYTIPTLMF